MIIVITLSIRYTNDAGSTGVVGSIFVDGGRGSISSANNVDVTFVVYVAATVNEFVALPLTFVWLSWEVKMQS